MASCSAVLKMTTVCALALLVGQLLVATPSVAVCVPGNCPICVPGACRFCVPGNEKCVICVQLCICDCNLDTFECSGVCYKNCMLRPPLN